jgi:hypothetical protein
VERKRANLGRRVAALDDDAAAPLLAELKKLAERKRQVEADLAGIRTRHEDWLAAQARLDEVHAWCRDVASRLGSLTYAQNRVALDALGVG